MHTASSEIWHDPALIADEQHDYAADSTLAGRFLTSVAERLKLPARFVFPAYEDSLYYLWREGALAQNVSAEDSRLEEPLERARLRKVFSHSRMRAAKTGSSRNNQASSSTNKVGAPSKRASSRANK